MVLGLVLVLVLGHAHVQGQVGMVLPRPPPSLLDAVEMVPTRHAYNGLRKSCASDIMVLGRRGRMDMQIGFALAPHSGK